MTSSSWWKKAYTLDLSAPLPPTDSTKDIARHPFFIGGLSRLIWRYTFLRLTRAGRWFAFITFVLVFNGATTLEIQAYIPALYAAALWAVAEGTVYLSRPKARLIVRHADRIGAGETLQIEAQARNVGRTIGYDWNLLPTKLPLELDAVQPQGTPLGTLRPDETRRARLGIFCPKRGEYTLKGYRIETDFPFGLMNAYTPVLEDAKLLVYPAYTPLRRVDVPVGQRHHPGGVALAAHRGDSMELLGNREYREGDRLRDIDWRATARMAGAPIVREWREEFFERVGVVLDTHVPAQLKGKTRTAREAAFERAVSMTAAIADYMAGREFLVDIFAAGPNLYHLTAGPGLSYRERILDILAAVEKSESNPLEIIEPQIQAFLDQLTTVVCVFIEYGEAQQAFVKNLRQSGAGVKVIVLPPDGAEEAEALRMERDTTVISAEVFAAGVEIL